MLTQEEIKHAITKTPSLPVVVTKALDLLGRDEVEMGLLSKMIQTDPVIAGRVLLVANSSFYGMNGKVGSLSEAFVVLGTKTIRNIILAAGVVATFPKDAGHNLDFAGLWQHAVAAAVTAKILAEIAGHDAETALIAALLHDIGKMVLDACFTREYSKVIQYRDVEDCLILEAEEAVLGVDHGSVGALLVEQWQLPKAIVEAVKDYAQPGAGNENPLVDLVHVANIVSRGLGVGDAGDSLVPALDQLSIQRLGLDLSHIENSLADIEEAVSVTASLLD